MTDYKKALVIDNIRLAYWTAQKYKSCGIELEELQGIALMGLVKAAEKYNPSGAAFSTFAVRIMENDIVMEIRRRRKCRTISLESEVTISGKGDTAPLEETLPCSEKGYDRVEAALLFPALMDSKNLKEKEKIAIWLVVCQEMKQCEAADVMQVSQSIVSRYVKSGIKKMRVYLEGEKKHEI